MRMIRVFYWLPMIEAFGFLVLFAILAWKFREINECFLIKRELKQEAVIALLFTCISLLLVMLFPDIGPYLFTATLFVFVISEHICGALLPLYHSYRTEKDTARNLLFSVPSLTLEGLLGSPGGRRAFAQHLTREFSVENFMFVSEVDELKRMNANDVDLVFREACRVYMLFTRRGAPFEVNLSDARRLALENEFRHYVAPLKRGRDSTSWKVLKADKRLIDVFGSPQRSAEFYLCAFDTAYEDIMNMLRVDSFIRFCQSDLFEQFARENLANAQ